MNWILIMHILVGILNAVAACGCLTVVGMKYIDRGEADLVNLLLGIANLLCAIYNTLWVANILNVA